MKSVRGDLLWFKVSGSCQRLKYNLYKKIPKSNLGLVFSESKINDEYELKSKKYQKESDCNSQMGK